MAITTPRSTEVRLDPAANGIESRLAAIDIGSNSLHMVISQVHANGAMTELWRVKHMVGLGRLSFPSHRLSPEAIDLAIISLRRMLKEAHRRQCEKIVATATSAVREAINGGELLERARRELGLRIRILSGREEARLIYLGVRHSCNLANGPHLILDIGGGSVEFIVASADCSVLLESRKLGAARMTAQFIRSDPIDPRELSQLMTHYAQELSGLCQKIRSFNPVSIVGTSGTLEDLAAMCTPPGVQRNGAGVAMLERDRFERLLGRLLESTAVQRAEMPGLDPHRKDQITAGALLVGEIFKRLDKKEIHLCRSALREGMLIDYVERHMPELTIRRQIPDRRRRSVLALAHRCQWDQVHSEHVSRLCLELFDQLQALHGMGSVERELVEYAALLHDIGWHIAQKRHHKHSMYLIQEGGLKGFSDEEIQIIANIARYHRKAKPKAGHRCYRSLPARARDVIKKSAALLRLADGLDRSHCGVVTGLRCTTEDRRVKIFLRSCGDCQLERWAARRKAGLFIDVFNRRPAFR